MYFTTVTIANGASLSSAATFPQPSNAVLVGIKMPAAWTAAALSFQGSHDGAVFGELSDATGLLAVASASAVADAVISLDPNKFTGCHVLKVRSGSLAAAVNQGAERILTLIFREVHR